MNPPKISWIMPAYNAGEYIAEAIESVMAQTETDWELIVADDGSTDDTAAIAGRYAMADGRIRLISSPTPSGGAYQPRKRAIEAARGEILAPLDADDRVDPDYLRRLLDRMEECDADIVYPMMCGWDDGRGLIQYPDGLTATCGPGKEYLKFTLDGWRIACNGGVIRRDLYMRTYAQTDSSISYSCADELLTRQLLWRAARVAVSDVKYYYRSNPDSITRRRSGKLFDFMTNNMRLIEMTRECYGADSEEYRLAQRQNFNGIFDALRLLDRYDFDPADRRRAHELIKEARRMADRRMLPSLVSRRYLFLFDHSRLPAIPIIRYGERLRDAIAPARALLRKGRKGWRDLAESMKIWRGRIPEGSESARLMERLYDRAPLPEPLKRGAICMLDGEIHHGGLTDRMRGILSAYSECKKRGIPLYINWTHPFPLTDYLQPATFDWRIRPEEISHSARQAQPVVIDDLGDFQSRIRMMAALRGEGKLREQTHLYTNADFARGDYARLYSEVFRPSERLARETERHRKALGEGYWSVTTRFVTLLGDFTDWVAAPLAEKEQRELLEKVTGEFLRIAAEVPEGKRILVTSDSIKFLRHIRNADPRVYIVEGDVKNIDLNPERADGAWMKTFIDQQLIMGADTVVRLRTGEMYATGFPRFAAEIGGARFIDRKF